MLFFSSKIFKAIKVLLFLAAVGAAVYFGYNYYDLKSKMPDNTTKQSSDDNNSKNTENSKETVEELKEVLVTDSIVEKAMKEFNTIALTDSEIYGGYNIKNITKKQLLFTALENLDVSKLAYCASDESQLVNITIDDINNALKNVIEQELTLDDVKNNIETSSSFTLTNSSISYNQKEYGVNIVGNNIQVIGSCHGVINPTADTKFTKKVAAKKNSEFLYVYEKVAFGKYFKAEGNDFVFAFYDDVNKTNRIESLINNENTVRKLDWSKYKTYKYTFKMNNGNYYFDRVEYTEDL